MNESSAPSCAIKLLDSGDLGKYTTGVFLLPNKHFYILKKPPIGSLGNWMGNLACPRRLLAECITLWAAVS
jgi:hypothetical protein